MLGVYSCSGAPASGLTAFAALRAPAAGSKPIACGALAIAAEQGSVVSSAEADGVSCIIDGHLYEPSVLARSLALGPAPDAELVAHLYRRYGNDGLSRLRGRYSVALWNHETGQGALTPDILATCDLFVSRTADALIFASELPDLLSLLPARPGPDPVAFPTWLGDGTCPEGKTLYERVSRLRAGELISLGTNSAEIRRYWRPRHQPTMRGTRAELADGLRAHLERSIRRRLSPGSSAVILSGGLDSSIVTAIASREKPPGARVQAYSAVFPGADYDESSKIQQVADSLGTAPRAIQIEPQGTLWLALHYTKSWQMPLIAAGSLIDIAATAAAADDGADVVLDGQTGDELFGLSPYLLADRVRQGRLLAAIAIADRWPIGRRTTARNKVWLLKELGLKGAAPHRLGRFVQGRRDRMELGPPWLLPGPRREYVDREDRWTWKRTARGPLWWRYLADVLVDAPHRELRLDYLRHRAASEGIVSEPPLYDVDLIDYCLRLPPELAFDSRFDRPLVREAMRGLIPEEVRLQTRKADFTSFCQEAMITADAPGIGRLLTDPDAAIGAYVELEWVRQSWGDLCAGRHDPRAVGALWRLTAAECWLRSQSDPDFIDTTLAKIDVLPPSVRSVSLTG